MIDWVLILVMLLQLLGPQQDVLPNYAGNYTILPHLLHIIGLRLQLLQIHLFIKLCWRKFEAPALCIISAAGFLFFHQQVHLRLYDSIIVYRWGFIIKLMPYWNDL